MSTDAPDVEPDESGKDEGPLRNGEHDSTPKDSHNVRRDSVLDDDDDESEERNQQENDEASDHQGGPSETEAASPEIEPVESAPSEGEEKQDELKQAVQALMEAERDRPIPTGPDRTAFLRRLGKELHDKLRDVFVDPPGFKDCLSSLRNPEPRVLVVHGARRTGKASTGLMLGRRALESHGVSQPGCFKYDCRNHTGDTLFDIVRSGEISKGSVLLIEDAFDVGIRARDLDHDTLPVINGLLQDRQSYVVLTTTSPLGEIASAATLTTFHCTPANLDEALEKHLEYYASSALSQDRLEREDVARIRAAWPEIRAHLETPSRIDELCAKIGRQFNDDVRNDVQRIALETSSLERRAVRQRFLALQPGQRLFAMLTCMFEGTYRPALVDLYGETMKRLARSEYPVEGLGDARTRNIGELIDLIDAEEDPPAPGVILFRNHTFREETRQSFRDQTLMLWDVVEIFKTQVVERFHDHVHLPIRRAFASGMAQVGVHHVDRLSELLDELATADQPGIRATAGHVLRAFCKAGREADSSMLPLDRLRFVTRTLKRWSQSHDLHLLWSVSSATWMVYDVLALDPLPIDGEDEDREVRREILDELRQSLQRIIDRIDDTLATLQASHDHETRKLLASMLVRDKELDFDNVNKLRVYAEQLIPHLLELEDAVAFAIMRVFINCPEDAVALVREWLADRQERPRRTNLARRCAARMFGVTPAQDEDPDDEKLSLIRTRHEVLLNELLPEVLGHATALQQVLHQLSRWAEDPDWTERVGRAMFLAVHRAETNHLPQLAQCLASTWLRSSREEVRTLANQLIARTEWVRGFPADVPGGSRSIVALGASTKIDANANAPYARQLFQYLCGCGDTTLYRLGSSEALVEPSGGCSPDAWEAVPHLVPLLGPILEDHDQERTACVTVVSEQAVVDENDFIGTPWQDRILMIRRKTLHGSEGLRETRCDVNTQEFLAATTGINERIAGFLGERKPHAWRTLLEPWVDEEVATVDQALSLACRWGSELVRWRSAPDPARIVTGLLLWAAALDLPATARWIHEQLEGTDEAREPAPEFAVAEHGRRVLLQIALAEHSVRPSCDRRAILSLAGSLLRSCPSRDSAPDALLVTDTLLELAAHEEWLKDIVTSPEEDEPCMLEIYGGLNRELRRFIADVLASRAATAPDAAERPEILRRERLRGDLHVWSLLGTQAETLPTDADRILLIVDCSLSNRGARETMGKLCEKAIARLGADVKEGSCPPIQVHRMGISPAIAVPETRTLSALDTMPHGFFPPPLIGSILESVPSDRVKAVVLITGSRSLDQADWLDAWRARLVVLGPQKLEGLDEPEMFVLVRRNAEEDALNALQAKIQHKLSGGA